MSSRRVPRCAKVANPSQYATMASVYCAAIVGEPALAARDTSRAGSARLGAALAEANAAVAANDFNRLFLAKPDSLLD